MPRRRFWKPPALRSPATISQSEVTELPLSGRNYLDIALFVPGVSPTNTAANQLFAETSAMPGQGISVGSQRNFSNSFIIDGVSANDDAAGVAGAFIGLDVVQEFQVVTSGGQAELGRALGGYINVVTKSGGNAMHGDRLRIFPQQPLQRRQRALQYRSAAHAGAVWRKPLRTDRARQDFLLREFRSPRSESIGTGHHRSRERGGHQRAAQQRRISGAADLYRRFPESRAQRELLRAKSITTSATRTSSAPATASITSKASTRAAPAD